LGPGARRHRCVALESGELGVVSGADKGSFGGAVVGGSYARHMSRRVIHTRLIVVLLGLGVVSPVLYFGAQLVCGLMTDGYSFSREAASDLGTSDRPYHGVFNGAAFATGCSLVCGGIGLLLVSMRPIPRRVATIIVAVCCLSAGAAALMAALYPLPDVRHGGGPIGAGMFVAPFAVAFALGDRVRFRPYLGLNIAVFVAGGVILNAGHPAVAGIGQRLLAGAVFPALALVCGLWLAAPTIRTPTRKAPAITGAPK
jgi:hypothetical membrane protein